MCFSLHGDIPYYGILMMQMALKSTSREGNLLVLTYNYKILLASGRFRALLINFVRTKRG